MLVRSSQKKDGLYLEKQDSEIRIAMMGLPHLAMLLV
jgi:hypothetical protein